MRTMNPWSMLIVSAGLVCQFGRAGDWPMYGRDATRNPVSPETHPPINWDVSSERNIAWKAKLGSVTFATPVVSGGLVWIGTNQDDAGAPGANLLCFRESDGALLFRHFMPAPKGNRFWGAVGATASPLIEGDRLWFVAPAAEVLCLDIAPLRRGESAPREIWRLDMMEKLGVVPRLGAMGGPQTCSIGASHGEYIYVITGNGKRVSWDRNLYREEPPDPKAPALLCLDKNDGRIVWSDRSPTTNVLFGEWSSPMVIEVDGRAQVVAPQGDGWVRAFEAETGEPIWQFDMTPKKARGFDRNFMVPPPVFHAGKLYIAAGGYIELGEGPGRLVAIDPRGKGDVSLELPDGAANPNSAAVWHFDGFGRAMGTVAIQDGLVIAPSYGGLLYCLDAETGAEYWRHDLKSYTLSSPLIVDGKIFQGVEDGNVQIFDLGRSKHKIAQVEVGSWMYGSPIYARGSMYVTAGEYLYAIKEAAAPQTNRAEARGDWPQWRGPLGANLSRDTGLLPEWPENGPPLLWTATGLGLGIHPVSVAGGKVFTTGNLDAEQPEQAGSRFARGLVNEPDPEGHEVAWALDAETGERIWVQRLGSTVRENSLMRWLTQRSPTVDGNLVFTLTVKGKLLCLDAATGRKLWERDYPSEFGARGHVWGYRDTPVVDGDRLICTPFGTNTFIAALEKRTGATIWSARQPRPPIAGHASLAISEINDFRQYVVFHGRGLSGFAASDGALLWDFPRETRTASSYTPLALDDGILSPNGYGGGLVRLKVEQRLDRWHVSQVYRGANMFDPFQDSTVRLGQYLYTARAPGQLVCLDISTGGEVWSAPPDRSAGRLALIYADHRLYVRHANGVMTLVDASSQQYSEKGSFKIPNHERSVGVTFPIIANGRLYLRDNDRLHCYDISAGSAGRAAPEPRLVVLNSAGELGSPEAESQPPRLGRDRAPDAVFVPTPHDVVEKMLELAQLRKEHLLVDLGSGDGRIPIAAARNYGSRALGYEIDGRLADLSRAAAAEAKLDGLVTIEHEDIFTRDFSQADIVTVFLYPRLMERLIPQFQKLKPGARILSHQFEMPGVTPDEIHVFDSKETGDKHRIFIWTTPLKVTAP